MTSSLRLASSQQMETFRLVENYNVALSTSVHPDQAVHMIPQSHQGFVAEPGRDKHEPGTAPHTTLSQFRGG